MDQPVDRSSLPAARARGETRIEPYHKAPPETRSPRANAVALRHLAALGLGAGALYVATAARTITWLHGGTDGAELSAAAYVLGIPHPTGYPAPRRRSSLHIAADRRGGVARRPHLHLGRSDWSHARIASRVAPDRRASAGALCRRGDDWRDACVAPLYWTQGTIAETYSLNAAFNLGEGPAACLLEPRR